MLNEELQLNQNVFSDECEQVPTRNGYGEGLLEVGKENNNVVALSADLTESTKTNAFADAFPERFIEVGITEQNMASVASGLAAMGKVPFIASYAMFSPGRNWEQIRTTVCYNDSNVKIAGAHAGISVGPDGGTHQALEDIAIARVIPNMKVLYPCDAIEAKKMTKAVTEIDGPTYIRLAREKTPVITTEHTPFEFGRAHVYFQSKDKEVRIGIVSSGPLLANALKAAKQLDEEGVGVRVLNMSTIKPLPEEDLLSFREGLSGIVSVEEHQVRGGVGSAISEFFSQKSPISMRFVGVDDRFGQSGTPDELIEHYGMGIQSIVEKGRELHN